MLDGFRMKLAIAAAAVVSEGGESKGQANGKSRSGRSSSKLRQSLGQTVTPLIKWR